MFTPFVKMLWDINYDPNFSIDLVYYNRYNLSELGFNTNILFNFTIISIYLPIYYLILLV